MDLKIYLNMARKYGNIPGALSAKLPQLCGETEQRVF
jgi:hypothetical protein